MSNNAISIVAAVDGIIAIFPVITIQEIHTGVKQ